MSLQLPQHVHLTITHNSHAVNYVTVAQAVADGDHGYGEDDFVSPEEKQRAIETNEHWFIQWYPDTPVGFCLVAASTLEACLEAIR